MENLKLETEIQQELNCMTLRSLASVDLTVPTTNQKNMVQEFFLLMAICNTVVVSLHAHEDPVSTHRCEPHKQQELSEDNAVRQTHTFANLNIVLMRTRMPTDAETLC